MRSCGSGTGISASQADNPLDFLKVHTCGSSAAVSLNFPSSLFTKPQALNSINNFEVNTMPDTRLHKAVKQGNKTLVKNLLEKGASISIANSDGNTPLHLSFLNNQSEITDLILSHMKKISNYSNHKNHKGISHLHIASATHNMDLVQALINNELNTPSCKTSALWPSMTPLDLAIEQKSPEVAQCLAKAINLDGFAYADENFKQHFILVYHVLATNGKAPSCNILPEFHYACYFGKPESVESFIRSGADVNEPMSPKARYCGNYTPLHLAIEGKNKETVQLLLDNGADPNRRTSHYTTALHLALYTDDYRAKDTIADRLYAVVKNKEEDLMDLNGLTYLHVACTRNDVELVKKLLDEGADVNRRVLKNFREYSNFTPLHFAVKWRREEMVKLLIERGAELNSRDIASPLHFACMIGHEDIIKLLLDGGADPTILDPMDLETVLHLLAEHVIDTNWAVFYREDDDDVFYSDDIRKRGLADLVERLVKAGVNVDATNDKGNTALHYACVNIYEGSIFAEQLIKWGADINLENKDLRTPLELAMQTNDYKCNNCADYVRLYNCVQRMKDLGFEVSPKNEECCRQIIKLCKDWERNNRDWMRMNGGLRQSIEMSKKRKKRMDEIRKMKKVQLADTVSLYDFVKLEVDEAAVHLGNEALKEILKETRGYEEYGDTIQLQYWKALKWAAEEKELHDRVAWADAAGAEDNEEVQEKETQNKKPGKKGTKRKHV